MDENNGFSVSAAKAFFEAAKRPEVQKAAVAAAKNPFIRNAAINAAKDPGTQVLSAMSTNGRPAPPPKKFDDNDTPPPPPPHRGRSTASSSVPPPPPSKPTYGTSSSQFSPPPSSTKPSSIQSKFPSLISELQGLQFNKPAPAPATNFSQPSYSPAAPVHPPPPANSVSKHPPLPQSLLSPTRPPPPKTSAPSRPPPPKSAQLTDPNGVVKYPFSATQVDELNCNVGDVVLLKKEVDDQWIYGINVRTGAAGIIPTNFLDVKIPLAPTAKAPQFSVPSSSGVIQATALYDYYSGTPGDLQFNAGEVITVLERVDQDWAMGQFYGQQGMFPVNFVHCPNLHLVPMKPPPAQPIGIFSAIYDYNSGVPGDLQFRLGDQIEVLEYVGSDWVKGRLHGQEGLLPFTYLSSTTPKSPQKQGLAEIQSIGSAQAKLYQALEDHHSDDPSNLYFSRGDRIIVVELVDEHFYRGKLEEFKTLPPGLVPKAKVVEL